MLWIYNIDRCGVHDIWPPSFRLMIAWHVTCMMLISVSLMLYSVLKSQYMATSNMSGTEIPKTVHYLFIINGIITVIWIHSVTILTAIKDEEHWLFYNTTWVALTVLIIGITLSISLYQLRSAVTHALTTLEVRGTRIPVMSGSSGVRRSLRDMKCLAIACAMCSILAATFEIYRGYMWYDESLDIMVWRADANHYVWSRDPPANAILRFIILCGTIRDWMRREPSLSLPFTLVSATTAIGGAYDGSLAQREDQHAKLLLPSYTFPSVSEGPSSIVSSSSIRNSHNDHTPSGSVTRTPLIQQQYQQSQRMAAVAIASSSGTNSLVPFGNDNRSFSIRAEVN
jgi:hypothetical protein